MTVSVYLSVAPPDGFPRWSEPDWDRWLRDHPWEAAEHISSRGDWNIFLFQVRAVSPRGRKLIEPHLEALINERPLETMAADDVLQGLIAAREEMAKKPATVLLESGSLFASEQYLHAMIGAARDRVNRAPTCADVWQPMFDAVIKVFEDAATQKRGVYFGNV
jgi:hypothetical protein